MDREYILFPDCKLVEGISRSAIYDLCRSNILFIPNTLYEILDKYKGFPIKKLQKIYKEDLEIINDYFEFLLENEFIYQVNSPIQFNGIESIFETPFLINNAIIDNDLDIQHNYKSIVQNLQDVACPNVLLRFFYKIDINDLYKILTHFSNSHIRDLVLSLPYTPHLLKSLKSIIHKITQISEIIMYSSPKEKLINYRDVNIYYIKQPFNSEECCGNIHLRNFSVNVKMYVESRNYNNCLYKKISVDRFGNIKNCPSDNRIFGNIYDTKFIEVQKNTEFKKYWNLKKDDIETCNICEFRYMCLDCRIYICDKNNIKSKPLKCKYNVYEEKWN